MKEKLRAHLQSMKSDPKARRQGIILALLLAGLVGVGCKYLLPSVLGPADAAAASDGPASLDMPPLVRPAMPRPGRIVTVTWPQTLQRDLFDVDRSAYAPVVDGTHTGTGAGPAAGPAPPAGAENPAQALPADPAHMTVAQVRKQASALRLQCVIMGNTPQALIGEGTYTVGQKVEGFTIKKIEPRRVVLELNGIDVDLKL
jgi:hypothetical protein